MAKYDVNYSCGHRGTVELYGKGSERENKIRWYESNVCPECYKAQKQAENKTKGLILTVNIDPFSLEHPIIMIFDGNTMDNKDQIKSIGYFWSEKPMSGIFGIFDKPVFCWNKRIALDDLDPELKKAESIGAKIENRIKDIDLVAYAENLKKHEAKQAIKAEKLKEIKKPVCPPVLAGNRWNGTIYGRSGSYCFYGNGQKINITDQQKADIEKYLKEKEAYKKAVAEIENSL